MATNINFSSDETAEKKPLTGKPALIISIFLLVVVAAVYIFMLSMKNSYEGKRKIAETQISEEQKKMNGKEYAEIIDFQNRIDILSQMVDDHAYWDSMLKNISAYFIPEIRLQKISAKRESATSGTVEITGIAPNMDAVSRELILLKDFSGADSLEFKGANTSITQAEGQSGVTFNATLKINQSAIQK